MKLGGAVEDDSYQTVQDLSAPEPGAVEEVEDKFPDDFERQSGAGPFVEESASPSEEVQGLEKDGGVFEEPDSGSEDELFADIPSQDSVDAAPEAPAEEAEKAVEDTVDDAPGVTEEPVSDEMFEEIDAAESGDEPPLAPPPPERRGEPGELIQSQMNLSSSADEDAEPGVKQPENKVRRTLQGFGSKESFARSYLGAVDVSRLREEVGAGMDEYAKSIVLGRIDAQYDLGNIFDLVKSDNIS